MNHASHLVGTALAGEAALAVALGLASLLLLFDRGHLHGTCGGCVIIAMSLHISAYGREIKTNFVLKLKQLKFLY